MSRHIRWRANPNPRTQAENLFARGAALEPEHAPLHKARAAAAERRGDVPLARRVYAEACTRGACTALLHGWGQLELRQGDQTVRVAGNLTLTPEISQNVGSMW